MKNIEVLEKFDSKGADGLWRKSWNSPSGVRGVKKKHVSLSYQRWKAIKQRLFNTASLELRPNYKAVENHFLDFQLFTEWSQSQTGYLSTEVIGNKIKFWCLDKDILSPRDSKYYSEDTCLFIPQKVNLYTCMRSNARGDWPLGVCWHTKTNKFMAQITANSKNQYLGIFEDKYDAHRAWQKAKIEHGFEIVYEFKDSHPKLSQGLENWIQPIISDYENYRETIFL